MFKKSLIYLSSYIPLYIMIYLNKMDKFTVSEFKKVFRLNEYFWIMIIIVGFISMTYFIYWFSNILDPFNYTVSPPQLDLISVRDSETLTFFITFLFPLLALDVSKWPSIVMNSLLILLIGFYFVKNNMLHYNIWILILGYRTYTDQFGKIIFSKSDLYSEFNKNIGHEKFPRREYYKI